MSGPVSIAAEIAQRLLRDADRSVNLASRAFWPWTISKHLRAADLAMAKHDGAWEVVEALDKAPPA